MLNPHSVNTKPTPWEPQISYRILKDAKEILLYGLIIVVVVASPLDMGTVNLASPFLTPPGIIKYTAWSCSQWKTIYISRWCDDQGLSLPLLTTWDARFCCPIQHQHGAVGFPLWRQDYLTYQPQNTELSAQVVYIPKDHYEFTWKYSDFHII